jgi:hypothetical protein
METVLKRLTRTIVGRPGSMSRWLSTLGLVGLAAALAAPATAFAADGHRRPNIVIILADDLGFADMGSFGALHGLLHAGDLLADALHPSDWRR